MPNIASSMPAGQGGYICVPLTKCLAFFAGASGSGDPEPVGVPPKKARATRVPRTPPPAGAVPMKLLASRPPALSSSSGGAARRRAAIATERRMAAAAGSVLLQQPGGWRGAMCLRA
eukprot:CAMPEP_0179079610 /NCGR_PEP_ID=MMETSP0796-20121207/35731_1 /TAXON_ID=73915 /ORGANISM="Pyrodinium bahamense, Strain pbaha01" /LENGTH=116 /DNA_ID=CAMNT_0020776951 /DNA_START=606 /DNA_END=953 /DNA_ORIENTATION=-